MNDNDENKIIESIESGEWESVKDFNAVKSQLMKAASETALKDYRINVRVSKRDVEALNRSSLYKKTITLYIKSKRRENQLPSTGYKRINSIARL